jgi:hypothetical protein
MMECNYISLSCADMANHYLQCDGVSYENDGNGAAIQRDVIQSDQKVMQPVLYKHLLMVAIQYNSIGLINTRYHCDYTRAHAGHVML